MKGTKPSMVCASMLTLLACGDEPARKGATCGAGTTEKDGVCLAQTDDRNNGDGDNEPPEAPPKGSDELACGTGTMEVDGECIVTPVTAEPQRFDSFAITQLVLEWRGMPLTSASLAKLQVDHPIDVTIAVRYEGAPATLPLLIGLGDLGEGGGSCILGGLQFPHPGTGEWAMKHRLIVSKQCLADLADEDSGKTADSRDMAPLVLIDPDDVLNDDDQLPKRVFFAAKEQQDALEKLLAQRDALASGKDPKPLAPSDLSLAECRGLVGEPGSCALALRVEPSKGIDFELTGLSLESSVLLLHRCFQDQAGLDAYATNAGLPTGYICNRSIVRGIDDEGEPLPLGNPKDFTYGVADIEADSTVTAFGIPVSAVSSADELLQLGTMTDKGFVLNLPPEEITNNALGDDGAYSIRYFLRPAHIGLQQGSDASLAAAIAREGGLDGLVSGGKLLPIYLHAEGEQAKGDEEPKQSGQERAALEETIAIPHAPTEYSHGLYVENDCGRFNDPSLATYRPGTPACNPALTPRDALLYGAHKDATDFFVVACITDGADGALPESDDIHNNCVERPLVVARPAPRKLLWDEQNPETPEQNPFADDEEDVAAPGFTNEELFAYGDSSGWAKNFDWDQRLGNNDLALTVHTHTRNSLNLPNGASTDNEAKLGLSSGVFGFSVNLVRAYAQAAARSTITGSFYDYGLELFGARLVGERKEAQIRKTWDLNYTKSWSKSARIFIQIAMIDVGFTVEGQAGLEVYLYVIGRDTSSAECTDDAGCVAIRNKLANAPGEYPDRVGEVNFTLTPYGLLKARAHAALSIELARAGAAGEITLADLRLPANAMLQWGVTGDLKNLAQAKMILRTKATVRAESQFLAGRVYLFADAYLPDWCTWYPCFSWSNVWEYTLASWSGWSYQQALWSSPQYFRTLTASGLSAGHEVPVLTGRQLSNEQTKTCLGKTVLYSIPYKVYPLELVNCVGGFSWTITYEKGSWDDPEYSLRYGSDAVSVVGASTAAGAVVDLAPRVDGNHQRVKLTKRGSGYEIKFMHSGMCLEARTSAPKLTQRPCHGGSSQLFKQTIPIYPFI